MENPKAPNYRRLAILAVLFIVISTVLLFWARDVIREVIVIPLSYIFFVIGIIIDYTPQIFFWVLVLLIGVRIAYLSIARKKIKEDAELAVRFRPNLEKPVTSGRVSFWVNKVYLLRSGRGIYYTRIFHEALSKSLFQLLAYRNRMTAGQVEEGLKDGSLNIPEDVRAYALESLAAEEGLGLNGRFWDYAWQSIVTFFRGIFMRLKVASQSASAGTNSLEPQAESSYAQNRANSATQMIDPRLSNVDERVRRVLKFMEEELEVPHDNTGR